MHTHQKDPSEPFSGMKCGSALLSFKQPKTMFVLTNTKHTGLLDVQNGRPAGCPGRWVCTERNAHLGTADRGGERSGKLYGEKRKTIL